MPKKKLFHHKFSSFDGDVHFDVSSEFESLSILYGASLEQMFRELEKDGFAQEAHAEIKKHLPNDTDGKTEQNKGA